MKHSTWQKIIRLELNWGVKRALKKIVWYDKWPLVPIWFDNTLIYPLFFALQKYFYARLMYHYGFDYRTNDQKSQNVDKQTHHLGYPIFHYGLLRNTKPENVLIIGSMYGAVPYMLARACQDNGQGHVYFVDANFNMNSQGEKNWHNFGQGFWTADVNQHHFSYLLDQKYLSVHVMTSRQFAKQFKHLKFDYICIDGDHRYEGGKEDFELFWPKLKERGYLTFHDVQYRVKYKGITFGFWKLWDELSKKYPHTFEVLNDYSGLGVIQKITKPRKYFKAIYK